MISIPRSRIFSERIKSEADFHAAVQACRAAFEAHCLGPPDRPVPMFDDAVEAVVARISQEGPVASRGPDQFIVQEYEIFDDAPPEPPAPPPPSLEQRKAILVMDLHTAAQAARDAVLSPARAQLLNLDVSEALAVPEQQRSPAQHKMIEAFTAYNSRCADIARNVALAQVEIEDLTEGSIGSWRIPPL